LITSTVVVGIIVVLDGKQLAKSVRERVKSEHVVNLPLREQSINVLFLPTKGYLMRLLNKSPK
jgi:hypothetical protein